MSKLEIISCAIWIKEKKIIVEDWLIDWWEQCLLNIWLSYSTEEKILFFSFDWFDDGFIVIANTYN